MIIASPDEKRFNAACPVNQICALKSPLCSLTDLQLCINVHENSEVQNGSDIGSPKRTPKTRCFLNLWRVDKILRSITPVLTSLCFFSLGPWITAIDSNRSRRRSEDPSNNSSLDLAIANACKTSFDVPSRKCLAQPGDHHGCQESDTSFDLKKLRKFSKNTRGPIQSSQKNHGDEAEFSKKKKLRGIAKTKNPRARTFGANLTKARGNNSSKWN